MGDEKRSVANDAVILTRREVVALDRAATDSLLLAVGLDWDEIIAMRCKLRSGSSAFVEGAIAKGA